jgi:hypothetical protein
MTRKLTRITPEINGYAVVIVQEASIDGKPGAYLGCIVQTPENIDDGAMVSLTDAMKEYLKQTGQQAQPKQARHKSNPALHSVAERIERVTAQLAAKDRAKRPVTAPSEPSQGTDTDDEGHTKGFYK